MSTKLKEQTELKGGATGPENSPENSPRRVALIRDALQRLKAEGDGEDEKTSVATALREEYKNHLDLYKHYLTVAATFNAFYYAVTGAVVSYALTGGQWRAAALIFPMLMTFFFVLVFWKAWKLFAQAEEDIKDIAGSLGCERAEVHILTRILQCSYYMYFFNCLALLILLISKLTGLYPLD
jgi:hypothetical protein